MPDLFNMVPETSELEIVVPGTEHKVGLCLELSSLSSDACVSAFEENTEEAEAYRNEYALEHNMRAEEAAEVELPKDMRAKHNRRLYGAAIVSWNWYNGLVWKGSVPDLTPDNVMDVLTNRDIYVQVVREVSSGKDFFGSFVESLSRTSETGSDTTPPEVTD